MWSPPAPTALQCLANDGALVTSGALVSTGLTLFDNNAILSLDSGRVRTFLSPLDTRFCVSLFNRLSPNDQIAARAKILSPCWPNHSVKVKKKSTFLQKKRYLSYKIKYLHEIPLKKFYDILSDCHY